MGEDEEQEGHLADRVRRRSRTCLLLATQSTERQRAHCIGCAQTGTFLYTFAGAGATASFVLGNILKISGLGSA